MKFYNIKIIGHPVFVGDVIQRLNLPQINNNRIAGQSTLARLLNKWEDKRKPIDNQSDAHIEFVYQLVQGE